MMAITCNYNDAVFSIEGYSLSNVRTRSTILLCRSLRGNVESLTKPRTFLVQYDDAAQRNLKSVAYGRRRGWFDVDLIPDPFFLENKGFATIRNAALDPDSSDGLG